MIENISIRNFKSIKQLDFKAKRVNIFIGEPNTGKSNILEALGMFSLIHSREGDVPIRYQEVSNLFYDDISYPDELHVKADQYSYTIQGRQLEAFTSKDTSEEHELFTFNLDKKTANNKIGNREGSSFPVKYYHFKVLEAYNDFYYNILRPPYGSNLFEILKNSKMLKTMSSAILQEKGYQLGLRQKQQEVEVIKVMDDTLTLYTYPYQNLSDTLQRIIFYLAVIETNKDATILLEEPESNLSPFYTRDLAERIARDTDNQYFLVTHNPYFLISLIEKTKFSDLSISVTYLDHYQTKLKRLSKKDIAEITEMDTSVFFNLDKFIEVESIY